MRHAVATLVVLLILAAPRAHAQSCHAPEAGASRADGVRVGLSAEAATYSTVRFEGDFQGLQLWGTWTLGALRTRAALPGYRISRNGLAGFGLGDLLLEGEAALLRAPESAVEAGLRLGATLPTGDASRDLGMGHAMLMPGVWGRWHAAAFFVQAQASYGRALGSTEGHHHGGSGGPIVSPMNMSELGGAVSAGYRLSDAFQLRGGAYGAAPVGITGGVTRAAALLALDVTLQQLDFSLEGHLPVAGAPFSGKVLTTVGMRF